jgi:clan AA aspartic protease
MKGKVNEDIEAVLKLTFIGPQRRRRTISAVIDTGFSGSLTLPRSIIRSLKLPRAGTTRAELGDGKLVWFNVYAGFVLWHRRRRCIEIHESESVPLVGMALLEGSELVIQVKDGGLVNIRAL